MDRLAIVTQMGTVGGADLNQSTACHGHDVGNTKGATDLDQFTARQRHFTSTGQRGEHQQDCSSIVVDHSGCFSTRQFTQHGFGDVVALATLTTVQIIFNRDGMSCGLNQRCDSRFRQGTAAKVGMYDCAGQVEDSAQCGGGFIYDLLTQQTHQLCMTEWRNTFISGQ